MSPKSFRKAVFIPSLRQKHLTAFHTSHRLITGLSKLQLARCDAHPISLAKRAIFSYRGFTRPARPKLSYRTTRPPVALGLGCPSPGVLTDDSYNGTTANDDCGCGCR